jgi:hypothetical protein
MPFIPRPEFFFILEGGFSIFYFVAATGIIILILDSITENRATVLSLVVLLISIPSLLHSYWMSLFLEIDLELLTLMEGVCIAVSVGVLYIALKIYYERKIIRKN